MCEYFTEIKSFEGKVKFELHLSNYRTENEIGVDTSKFAKKVDLASLRSNVDELDVDKLKKCTNQLKQSEK